MDYRGCRHPISSSFMVINVKDNVYVMLKFDVIVLFLFHNYSVYKISVHFSSVYIDIIFC